MSIAGGRSQNQGGRRQLLVATKKQGVGVVRGQYHPYIGTNGAQPDWYLGWLIGALRLMPNLEISVFGHTLLPNPFLGGVFFPGIIFTLLYALPWLDRRFISRD